MTYVILILLIIISLIVIGILISQIKKRAKIISEYKQKEKLNEAVSKIHVGSNVEQFNTSLDMLSVLNKNRKK